MRRRWRRWHDAGGLVPYMAITWRQNTSGWGGRGCRRGPPRKGDLRRGGDTDGVDRCRCRDSQSRASQTERKRLELRGGVPAKDRGAPPLPPACHQRCRHHCFCCVRSRRGGKCGGRSRPAGAFAAVEVKEADSPSAAAPSPPPCGGLLLPSLGFDAIDASSFSSTTSGRCCRWNACTTQTAEEAEAALTRT